MTKRRSISTVNSQPSTLNSVSLVGAGPGDPGLITVAGLDRLREADVIVYDRLANPALLAHARPDAELIYVGKVSDSATQRSGAPSGLHGEAAGGRSDARSHDQPAINRLLIEKAHRGKRVVRLKGGDPFVFGRGGEEAEALRDAGIAFEIVPGVTSAVAVPAYAGIPVTHRGVASSFAVITGHEADHLSQLATRNSQLASPDTLIFLMGTKALPDIVDNLIANGRSADTPVAVIRWGTTPEQQTVVGTLADIVVRVEDAGLKPPAITVVGEVVRLREKLSWFENRPLFGERVLITRTRKQASQLARLLAAEGAIPIELPAIEIEATFDPAAVDAALEDLAAGRYAWTVFTSANAVDLWFDHMRDRKLDARAFGPIRGSGSQLTTSIRGSGSQPDSGTRIAAIGPATAAALLEHGITADLVPTEYIAESLAEALLSTLNFQLSTPSILLPRAEAARPELPEALRAAGAEVDEITLYRAAVPQASPTEVLNLLREGAIDIVTFTSSSTVRNLAAMLNGDISALTGALPPVILSADHTRARNKASSRRNLGGEAASVRGTDAPRKPLIACIGPITAATAQEVLGRQPDLVAAEYTVAGLVSAIRAHCVGRS